MKKLFAVLVALTLVLSMGTIALAAETGSITINNAINGETYDAYRIFDLESYNTTNGTYSYKLSEKWAGFDKVNGIDKYFVINDLGYVEWKASDENDSEDIKAFAEAAFAFVKSRNADEDPDNNIAKDGTAVANGNIATISNLTLGYYLVDTSLGTLCSITTTKPTASVTDKNGQPTIVKKIVEGTGLVDANNVAIGDTVNYQATVTAGKGTVNYVIHDTLSAGLDLVKGENKIVVKNTTDDYTLIEGTDYVIKYAPNTDCGCTFEIDLTSNYEETQLSENELIVVTYSATLNENAVIGSTGNPNEIYLTYGNAQETTKDTVITYTTKLTINKVDGNGDPLPGAGFTLYKGEAIEANKISEITGVTEFVWTGLEEGTYTLVETTVPAGYNKAADITFTIECAVPAEVDSVENKAEWSTKSEKIAAVDKSVFVGEVENNSGTLLPETGGIGTTIFYVVGGLLMAAALVLLVSKKRMATFA